MLNELLIFLASKLSYNNYWISLQFIGSLKAKNMSNFAGNLSKFHWLRPIKTRKIGADSAPHFRPPSKLFQLLWKLERNLILRRRSFDHFLFIDNVNSSKLLAKWDSNFLFIWNALWTCDMAYLYICVYYCSALYSRSTVPFFWFFFLFSYTSSHEYINMKTDIYITDEMILKLKYKIQIEMCYSLITKLRLFKTDVSGPWSDLKSVSFSFISISLSPITKSTWKQFNRVVEVFCLICAPLTKL